MIAAIYARKSTDEPGKHEEAKSVEKQKAAAMEFAATQGWTIAEEHIFEDDGISGAEFERRPGLQRLLATLGNGRKARPPFAHLVMMDLSRLGREQFETGYVLKRLLQGGVRVWCYLDGREVTAQNWVERAIISIRGGADEAAREDASLRVSKDFYDRVRKGHVTGGRVFGYRNVEVAANGKRSHVVREVEPTEAAVVRRIFTLTEQGRTDPEILDALIMESAPAPVPRGGSHVRGWSLAAIRAIRRNPLYHGEVVYGRRKVRDEWGQKKIQPRDPNEWIRNNDESLRIVPEDLWATVQARLDARSRDYRKARANGGQPVALQPSKHLLGGQLSCGLCGGSLIVRDHGRNGGQPRYACWTRHQHGPTRCAGISVQAAAIERAVTDALYRRVLNDEFLNEIIERATAAILEDHRATVSPDGAFSLLEPGDPAREQIRTLESEINKYAQAIATAGPLPSLLKEIKSREARLAALQERLAAPQAQKPKSARKRVPAIPVEDLRDSIASYLFSPEFQREALSILLTRRLVVKPAQEPGAFEFEGEGDLGPILGRISGSPRLKSFRTLPGFETPRDGGA